MADKVHRIDLWNSLKSTRSIPTIAYKANFKVKETFQKKKKKKFLLKFLFLAGTTNKLKFRNFSLTVPVTWDSEKFSYLWLQTVIGLREISVTEIVFSGRVQMKTVEHLFLSKSFPFIRKNFSKKKKKILLKFLFLAGTTNKLKFRKFFTNSVSHLGLKNFHTRDFNCHRT